MFGGRSSGTHGRRGVCLSIKWKNVLISRMARDYGHNGDCLKALCCREWEARTTMPRRTVAATHLDFFSTHRLNLSALSFHESPHGVRNKKDYP